MDWSSGVERHQASDGYALQCDRYSRRWSKARVKTRHRSSVRGVRGSVGGAHSSAQTETDREGTTCDLETHGLGT